jgi:chromosome segregation ATPase
MEHVNELQARVQAAAEVLAGRKEQHKELRETLQQLQAENARLAEENQGFRGEIAGIREKGETAETECERLRTENKRLIGDNQRHRDELDRFDTERQGLNEDRDQLNALLESLVRAVEVDASAEDQVEGPRVVEMAEVVANGTTGLAIMPPASVPQPSTVVSAMRDKYHAPEVEDVPNGNARKLMDKIKERIEAQR